MTSVPQPARDYKQDVQLPSPMKPLEAVMKPLSQLYPARAAFVLKSSVLQCLTDTNTDVRTLGHPNRSAEILTLGEEQKKRRGGLLTLAALLSPTLYGVSHPFPAAGSTG
ncbi:hypothetical protein C0Q70_05714 [Pomacea canaliculata]|uniref:Uncharacterized protein n=1 Tax=Pomacea canaliculata TaxID=400727 RepID=A0A2T7PLY7_POMCA|nr:hypothetical protein C0Q70_05714 [Pomacea canaliculata]